MLVNAHPLKHASSSMLIDVNDAGRLRLFIDVQPLNAFFYIRFIDESLASYVLKLTVFKLEQSLNISSDMYHIFDGNVIVDNAVHPSNTFGYT